MGSSKCSSQSFTVMEKGKRKYHFYPLTFKIHVFQEDSVLQSFKSVSPSVILTKPSKYYSTLLKQSDDGLYGKTQDLHSQELINCNSLGSKNNSSICGNIVWDNISIEEVFCKPLDMELAEANP